MRCRQAVSCRGSRVLGELRSFPLQPRLAFWHGADAILRDSQVRIAGGRPVSASRGLDHRRGQLLPILPCAIVRPIRCVSHPRPLFFGTSCDAEMQTSIHDQRVTARSNGHSAIDCTLTRARAWWVTVAQPATPSRAGWPRTSPSPRPRRQPQAAKDKSTERIDGIVALIMAIGRAMVARSRSRARSWQLGPT
jgi:hypothetical protein